MIERCCIAIRLDSSFWLLLIFIIGCKSNQIQTNKIGTQHTAQIQNITQIYYEIYYKSLSTSFNIYFAYFNSSCCLILYFCSIPHIYIAVIRFNFFLLSRYIIFYAQNACIFYAAFHNNSNTVLMYITRNKVCLYHIW